ncbi:MAG: lipoate--protein ligase family protein [Synechococcus sp.]|nr:lipoate--protein ligase family protein [Synechococcus sp.]
MNAPQHPAPPAPDPARGSRRPWRWLPPAVAAGAWQMALDDALLEQGSPALRLYGWARPTLSLGYHQRRIPPHWPQLAAAGVIELVRRPSGGRAVLHGRGDLTYALIWPDPPVQREEAYRQACHWLQQAFAALDIPLRFGGEAPRGGSGEASCFASATAADLVDPGGHKRIGSAQLWRRGRLLQHGSIQLSPDPELWRQLFPEAPPPPEPLLRWGGEPLPPAGHPLLQELLRSARRHLPGGSPVRLVTQPPTEAERAAVEQGLARYSEGLTLTSPVATMPRAT